jgi:AcrR family transcriptional regulator
VTTDTTTRPRLARAAEGRPRRGTPEGTRERLIAAAAEVLNRDGYLGTDSNVIARAAGYAPATFYKHFEDKRAILLAAYERWVGAEWRHIGGTLGASLKSREAARELTAWILAHHRRWRGLRASLLGLVGADPVVRAFYVAQRRRQLDWLAEIRGTHRSAPGDRELDAFLLFSFERVCDAMANGETEALGLDANRLEALLEERLAAAWRRDSTDAAR